MIEPVTVGSLVAETLSVAAEAVLKSGAGETVEGGYKALREKVSQWAPSEVAALEAKPGSIGRQAGIVKIVDAQPEEDRKSLRVLAEALVAKLKECAPRIGLDIGRLTALEAQLAAKDTENPQAGDDRKAKKSGASNGTDSAEDSAATPEQLDALLEFRKILTELASRHIDGSNKFPRNPFVKLVRWFQEEPGFEDTVAKYASMLPILETSGRSYSKTALIGIMALKARQVEIARTVYEEVRFQTTASAALDPVTKGITLIVLVLVGLSIIVATVLYGFVFWNSIPVNKLNDYVSQDVIHSVVVFCFGCFGGVVSLLNRLSEFDNKQIRSRDYLFMYGLTLPIVGGGFALVLAAVMDAKIISILDNRTQLFIVIGFLAGFSERFTQKLLQIVQDYVSGSTRQTNQKLPAETSSVSSAQSSN